MKYLFTTAGLKLLESLSFTRTLYAFDFDGTLAAIVENPESAKMSANLISSISELAKLSPVAIVSGRSLKDLKKILSFTPPYLIGNHGLEGLSLSMESGESARKTCDTWKKSLSEKWPYLKSDSGVFIEDKTYSLALHYRKSKNKKRARIELFEKIESLKPSPRIILGKSVMNLIPAGAPHKGVAILELMMKLELKAALYVGDDDTDEDVFSLPDEGILSVRVGHKKNSRARFFVKRQSEVHRIVKSLLGSLRQQHGVTEAS